MWIRASCQLSEHVYQVVTPASSHFLIFEEAGALVDTGLAALYDVLLKELDACLEDRDFLRCVLLTHSHYDHVGAWPYLKRDLPHLKLIVSRDVAESLSKPELLSQMYQQNCEAAKAFDRAVDMSEADWVAAFRADHIFGDGDSFPLGEEIDVKILALPGHSRDLTGFYVSNDGALVAAEALGDYRGRDKTAPCCAWNYEQYIKSIQKILGLDIKILGLPHSGALTGELARKFLLGAQADAEKFQRIVVDGLKQGQLIEEIHAGLMAEWVAENYSPEGPLKHMQEDTLKAMIQAVTTSASSTNT